VEQPGMVTVWVLQLAVSVTTLVALLLLYPLCASYEP
jgi:hypothetical protein